MKQILRSLLPLVAAVAMVGCADDNPWSGSDTEGGRINPSVTASSVVVDAIPSRSTLNVPPIQNFGLKLTKKDGSFAKEWKTLAEFDSEQTFSAGDYTLEAYYGKSNDEGYDAPYFYGATNVSITAGKTTDVDLEAALANTMVSIAFTEAFEAFFPSYTATLHSEGGKYITVTQGDTRPVHLQPGEVSIEISVVLADGRQTTISPAKFQADACHHYHVTLNVNDGKVGTQTLQVVFDDTVQQEMVEIDLSDELLNCDPPSVTITGDASSSQLEGVRPQQAAFNVYAAGGISEAIMTINADDPSYTTALGKEFDLCALTPSQQSVLESMGIKAIGFFNNPDKMGKVDVRDFIASLGKGYYHISLKVKDAMTRVNEEEAKIDVEVSEVVLQFVEAEYTPYLSTTAKIKVDFNGDDFSNVTVEAYDDYGTWKECEITATEAVAAERRTRAEIPAKRYLLTISIPQCTRSVRIRLLYGSKVKDNSESNLIMPDIPTFTLEGDVYSKYADFKLSVNQESSAVRNYVMENLQLQLNGTNAVFGIDKEKAMLYLDNLAPSTRYALKARIGDSGDWTDFGSFTTEGAQAVPNGDFETLTKTYDVYRMNQGGTYRATAISATKQNQQTYTVSEPNGWLSTNPTTANLSAATQNSWFVVLSAFNTSLSWESRVPNLTNDNTESTGWPNVYKHAAQSGSNAMVVRNVAWDNNGTVPGRHGYIAATSSSYYNPDAPNIANVSAGKLYLGSGTTEGVAFASRPSSLSGYYNYTTQDTGEKALVTVTLLNGSQTIAAGTATLAAASSYQQFNIPLTYSSTTQPTMLKITITSSNRADGQQQVTKYAEKYLQEAYGAVLVVDNLSFSYDRPGNVANKKRLTSRKK